MNAPVITPRASEVLLQLQSSDPMSPNALIYSACNTLTRCIDLLLTASAECVEDDETKQLHTETAYEIVYIKRYLRALSRPVQEGGAR